MFEVHARRFLQRRPLLLAFSVLGLLVACDNGIAGATVGPDVVETTADANSAVGTAIVQYTNDERAHAGLPALRSNSRLNQAARLQAEQMARVGQMAHVLAGVAYPRPEDRLAAAGYSWRAFGENVAFNQRSASSVLSAWMASAGHRANILDSQFTEMGAAVAYDSKGQPYYAQVFGRPM